VKAFLASADKDGNGVLSKDEFKGGIASLGVSEEDAAAVVAEVHTLFDKSYFVDFPELKHAALRSALMKSTRTALELFRSRSSLPGWTLINFPPATNQLMLILAENVRKIKMGHRKTYLQDPFGPPSKLKTKKSCMHAVQFQIHRKVLQFKPAIILQFKPAIIRLNLQ
jgi:hypothetical protein